VLSNVRLSLILGPAYYDVLRATGQEQDLTLTALDQVDAASWVQGDRFAEYQRLASTRL
jgi:hypothetical protein